MIDDAEWATDTWRRAAATLSEQLTEATAKVDRYRKIAEEMDERTEQLTRDISWLSAQLRNACIREEWQHEYIKLLSALVEAYAHDNQPQVVYLMGLCMEQRFNPPPAHVFDLEDGGTC